ncbi:GGDEF domain-containing protein [Oleidesulfovibrio sp.]|uniref:GGDEF domain-containing protein n=1 Tax=Oleidesulfovibrio sp. TaxID=2909707 RepID=UPI003A8838D3
MKNQLRTLLHKTLHSGTAVNSDPEVIRRTYMLNGFLLLSTFISALMAVLKQSEHMEIMYVTLWCASALYCTLYFFLNATGNLKTVSNITLLFTVVMGMVLIWHMGDQITYALWLFALPPAVFFTFGMKRSLITISILFTALLLWMPFTGATTSEGAVSFSYMLRVSTAFLALCLFSALGEYSRARTQKLLVHLTKEMEQCACTDPLTGLLNRRGIYDRLNEERARATRSGKPFSVIICDVDHFKSVNDCFGHQCGDHVLHNLAEMFRNTMRGQDIICRWGGEEFLFILPETDEQGAQNLAEKLRATAESSPVNYYGMPIDLTLSLGVQECTLTESPEFHIRMADQKLYIAKEQGRNKVISGNIEDLIPQVLIA